MEVHSSRKPNGAFDIPRPKLETPHESRQEAERQRDTVLKRFPPGPLDGSVRGQRIAVEHGGVKFSYQGWMGYRGFIAYKEDETGVTHIGFGDTTEEAKRELRKVSP